MKRSDKPVREKFHKLARMGDARIAEPSGRADQKSQVYGSDVRLTDWEPLISIGTAAAQVGLSVSALRKYEKEGLLIYHRSESGRRMLCRADVKRIQMIKHMMQDLGLNVAGILRILSLLPCWDLRLCTPGEKRACRAPYNDAKPCWTVRAEESSDDCPVCRECEVYRYGAYCAVTMKSLLHHLDDRKGRDEK